jgi:hypothetical protein
MENSSDGCAAALRLSFGFQRKSDPTQAPTKGNPMPEKATIERARRDAREGKSASTQAGEFVRDVVRHIRQGKHGATSTKQAIAIGLSEARRAGVKLPPPKKGKASPKVRRQAERDIAKSRAKKKPAPKRSRARLNALKKKGRAAASPQALSRQAKQSARRRGPRARSLAGKKAAQTRKRRAAA